MKRNDRILGALTLLLTLAVSCRGEPPANGRSSSPLPVAAGQTGQAPGTPDNGQVLVTNQLDIDFSKHAVTFIELGADRCIPCKAMQPIMKEIATEFAGKIQVVFYDVWKDPEPARKYRIQLIPTQVFMDQKGQEIFRHVGFFSKEEILKMLKEKGIL